MSNKWDNWGGRGTTRNPFKADQSVIDEAEQLGLDRFEIENGGGWRKDDKNRTHWLRLRQLIEYRKADLRIVDDAEFWKWFEDYRKTENIGQSRGSVSWSDYGGSWVSKPKDYLSDWWKGWGFGGSSDKERKLAIALAAVQSTVSVINNSGKKYVVSFSEHGETYTDFNAVQVKITPQAILDPKIEDDRAIKITTGLGLHEGSHAEYTEPLAEVLQKPIPLMPLRVSSLLLNILEDNRIEYLTSKKYPGFASYFGDIYEWGWDLQGPKAPQTWGPDLKAKLDAVVLMVKWPDAYEEIARKDKTLSAEFDWWKAWGEPYRTQPDMKTARKLVEDGLNRLRVDPNTAKQLDQMAKAEEQAAGSQQQILKLTPKQFEELLEQLKKQLGNPSSIDSCPSPEHGNGPVVQLTEEQAAEVRKLVDEKLEIHFSQFPDKATGKAPQIVVTKPLETEQSKRSYRPANKGLVQRLKANFFLRKRLPVYDERMLKKGMVDDEELWRVGVNDFRVFLQRHVEEQDFVSATMLVDCSGSMHGENISRAQMLATVLMECLSTMPGAVVRVRGHSYVGGDACNVYRIWDRGDPISRLGLFGHVDSGSNYDGYAIEFCAREMLADARPNETRLLFVLSDGRPNGGHKYSGLPAMRHVRTVTDAFNKKDMTVIQIAVDPMVGPADQQVMFANWIPFDAQKLPTMLGRLLVKLLGAQQ